MHHRRESSESSLCQSLVDNFYAEALLLADEARAWFDRARGDGESMAADIMVATWTPDGSIESDKDGGLLRWAGRNDPTLRIALSCESLRLTTRLMHIIAWLLMQRAIAAGELGPEIAALDTHRLGPSPFCDPAVLDSLPRMAQRLVEASIRLHERVAELEDSLLNPDTPRQSPVHGMLDRLARAI